MKKKKIIVGFLFTISVICYGPKENLAQTKNKKVALTFDDGPCRYTPQVLAVLEQYSVKATFFMTGRNANRYPERVRLVYAQGHQIANHTWSHPFLTKLSNAAIAKEMQVTNNRLERIICGGQQCSFKVDYMRPPYGNTNKRVNGVLSTLGFHIIKWNITSNDCFLIRDGKGPRAIVDTVFSQKRRNKEVVLFHDGGGSRQAVVKALPLIIERYRWLGYQFVRVDEI